MKVRLKDTWIKTIKKDVDINLDNRNETIDTLESITKERQEWKTIKRALMQ